jgi:hypothetical protein
VSDPVLEGEVVPVAAGAPMIGEPGETGPGVASVGAPLPVMPLDVGEAPAVVALGIEGGPFAPASPDWPWLDARRRAPRASKRPAIWGLRGTIFLLPGKGFGPLCRGQAFC